MRKQRLSLSCVEDILILQEHSAFESIQPCCPRFNEEVHVVAGFALSPGQLCFSFVVINYEETEAENIEKREVN